MDHLSQTFAALSDPTRRGMLNQLLMGEHTVSDLAAPYDMSAPAISKHLKVLEKADLITRRREAQTIYCAIKGDKLKTAVDWLNDYAQFWQSSFDRLDALIEEDKL